MRWQRIARLAIAVFVLVFAAIVVFKLRRPAKPAVTSQTPRVDQKTVAELGALTHTVTDDKGNIQYIINAARALTYPDGRQLLDKAEITLPGSQRPHDEVARRRHGAGHAAGRRRQAADRARHQGSEAHIGRRPRGDQRPGELRSAHQRRDGARRRPVHQGAADGIGSRRDLRPESQRAVAARSSEADRQVRCDRRRGGRSHRQRHRHGAQRALRPPRRKRPHRRRGTHARCERDRAAAAAG